jgi:hypothetical protein
LKSRIGLQRPVTLRPVGIPNKENVLKKILSPSNPNINIWINQNVGFGEFYKENNIYDEYRDERCGL